MNPTDDAFDGISLGTLDWNDETLALFQSDHEALTISFNVGYRSEQPNEARILPTGDRLGVDARQSAYLVQAPNSVANHTQRPSSGYENHAEPLDLPRQSEPSNLNLSLSLSQPPTPSNITPSASTYTDRPTQGYNLIAGTTYTESQTPYGQQSFRTQGIDCSTNLQEPDAVISYGARSYSWPTPALTSEGSIRSNELLNNQHSTPTNHLGRSTEPPQYHSMGHHRTSMTSTPYQNQSIQSSPAISSSSQLLTLESSTFPSVEADERQIETRSVPHQAPPPQASPYVSSMQAPLPLMPPAAPTRIKTEPPDRTSFQSVFHSSPILTSPTRAHALEKNRLAARKSRTKKRNLTDELAVQSRNYDVENQRLRAKVGELKDEAKALRDTIRQHQDCGGWTGDMQSGVESYLRKVDERHEEEDRQQAESLQGREKDDLDFDEDFYAIMKEATDE